MSRSGQKDFGISVTDPRQRDLDMSRPRYDERDMPPMESEHRFGAASELSRISMPPTRHIVASGSITERKVVAIIQRYHEEQIANLQAQVESLTSKSEDESSRIKILFSLVENIEHDLGNDFAILESAHKGLASKVAFLEATKGIKVQEIQAAMEGLAVERDRALEENESLWKYVLGFQAAVDYAEEAMEELRAAGAKLLQQLADLQAQTGGQAQTAES
ncbi:MAG: hypothetical protein LBF25_03180 [Puniceicoccales bacterium]|jgi:chromosome segregation ATPase|nr:hypothetical protein [Puniceicoccales bacterium]